MKQLKVDMQWGGKDNRQWMMNHSVTGFFLMNFPDCRNVNRFFKGLDKARSNKFEITIRPIGKGTDGNDEK